MKTIKNKITSYCWFFFKACIVIWSALMMISMFWGGVLVIKSYLN